MIGGIGLYEDSGKVTIIIESGVEFLSSQKRKDETKEGNYRLADGTLESWWIYNKGNWKLNLKIVSQTYRDKIITEYDLHRDFYFCPDTVNRASEIFNVKFAKKPTEDYNKKVQIYSMTMELKEI